MNICCLSLRVLVSGTPMRSVLGVRSFPYYVPWASLSPVLPSVRPLQAVPGEAGDAAVLSSLPREGQEVVLDRLDFVLTSLVALRREVEELRSSLQGLAGQIVGEVR